MYFDANRIHRASGLVGQTRSSKSRRRALVVAAFTVAISILAAALAVPSKIMANDDEVRTFTVDVATGDPYVQNDVDPQETVRDPLAFSPGDTFIQDGNIYPEGTIPRGNKNFDPNDATRAIGKYRVRGTLTTDLENFKRAAEHKSPAAPDLAFASELFALGSNQDLIMTDGTWPNAYFSARRILVGGTGHYREIIGEVQEENIGENKLGFCNLRVTFKIRKVADGHER